MNHDEPIANKLVRDGMVAIRTDAGWKCEVLQLTHQIDIDFYFTLKAEEEIGEFLSAPNREKEIEETADLVALHDAIIKHEAHISRPLWTELQDIVTRHMEFFADRINAVRIAKKLDKGEFDQLIVIRSETRVTK
jgi:predicted house-cleaning noncanonical NTP pyrophosphatase (MazG superfamily)